jgi:hypothetical protein
VLQRVREASTRVELRLLDRDEHPELRDELRICGAARVPVAVFMTEDFFECSRFGDRTLASYRKLVRRTDAAPSDPPPRDAREREGTIAEWVNECERVQHMMRLSPYLRERHGD